MSYDKEFMYAVQSCGINFGNAPNDLKAMAAQYYQYLPLAPSIDNFLHTNHIDENFVTLGKLAISQIILRHEKLVKGATGGVVDFPKGRKDFQTNWLTVLFRILASRKTFEDFCQSLSAFRFVTFNYDRIIEEFFFRAMSGYFRVSEQRALEAIGSFLNVVHVYGRVGDPNDLGRTQFGESNWEAIKAGAEFIRTFTEGVNDEADIRTANSWLSEAGTVVFLGFGYSQLNLEALRGNYSLASKRIIATAKAMSQENCEMASQELSKYWNKSGKLPKFEFANISCSEILQDNSKFLEDFR